MSTAVSNERASAYAALALAFASFGDAFLYSFLPVHYTLVGISVEAVGVLLSINRFVRMFTNTLVARVIAIFGSRTMMITAVIVAIISTLGYAFVVHFTTWLVLRLGWGLSFAVMRMTTLDFALRSNNKLITLGYSRTFQELGPMFSLLLAPFLFNFLGAKITFIALTILSAPSLYFSLRLPAESTDRSRYGPGSSYIFRWPSITNWTTILSSLIVDGVLVMSLGILIISYHSDISPTIATAVAASFLFYRRLLNIVFSTVGGWIASCIGVTLTFTMAFGGIILGLVFVYFGLIEIGVLLVFTAYSFNAVVTPVEVSKDSRHPLTAVAENATWRDVGAAVGTGLGGMVIVISSAELVFKLAIIAMIIALALYLIDKSDFKRFNDSISACVKRKFSGVSCILLDILRHKNK